MWQKGAYNQLAAPQYPPYPQTQQQYAQYTTAVYPNGGQGKRQTPQPYGRGYPKQHEQQWPNQNQNLTKQNYSPSASQQDLVRGYPTSAPYGLRMANPYYDSGYQSSTPPQSDMNNGYTYPQTQQQPQANGRQDRQKKTEDDEETIDSEAVPRKRLIKIVIIVLCIVLVGITVAAVAVWLALSTSSEDSPYDTTYNVIVKLDETWHSDLENANSVTYYELEMAYCSAISSIYDGLFKKCTVQQFLEGSVLVDSALTFDLQKLEDRIRAQGHTPDELNLLGSLVMDLKEAIASKEHAVLNNAEINTFNKFMSYQFIVKFNETFLAAWADPEDPAYKAKEQEYCQDIKTILGEAYADCSIDEMQQGSTIIHSKLTLDLKALIALTGDPEATNRDFVNTLTKLVEEAITENSPKKFKNAEMQSISKLQKVLVVPFESSMTLIEAYDPAYADLNSPQSKKLSETFCAEISALYKNSDVASAYQGCEVTDLKSGSIIISYVSKFNEDKLAASKGDVSKVKDIVVAGIAQSSGFLSKADPASITVVQGEAVVAQTPSNPPSPPTPSEESPKPTVVPSTVPPSSATTQSTVQLSSIATSTETSSQPASTTMSTNGDTSLIPTQASTVLSSTHSDKESSMQSQTTEEATTTATVATTAEATVATTAEATTTATVATTAEATTVATTETTPEVTTTSKPSTTMEATTTAVETTSATTTAVETTSQSTESTPEATTPPSTASPTTQDQTSTVASPTAATTQDQTSPTDNPHSETTVAATNADKGDSQ